MIKCLPFEYHRPNEMGYPAKNTATLVAIQIASVSHPEREQLSSRMV
jgi:hypothetical protein